MADTPCGTTGTAGNPRLAELLRVPPWNRRFIPMAERGAVASAAPSLAHEEAPAAKAGEADTPCGTTSTAGSLRRAEQPAQRPSAVPPWNRRFIPFGSIHPRATTNGGAAADAGKEIFSGPGMQTQAARLPPQMSAATAAPMDIENAKRFQAKGCEDLQTEEERAACYKKETDAHTRQLKLINLYKGLAFGGGLLLLAIIALVITLKMQSKKTK